MEHKLVEKLRTNYYKKCQKRLINKTPTIIASDCFGGLVYHNLGLKFMSPTINLYIEKEEFIDFVNNLPQYLDAELVEIKDSEKSFPVGRLEYNNKSVTINFMHYKTFEEAKEKWNERKKRVDFSNIYIIQLVVDATKDDIESFDKLPYKNKMFITSKKLTNSKNVVTHKVFLKKNYKPGEILHYRTDYSIRRHMDKIDYVSFLNRK